MTSGPRRYLIKLTLGKDEDMDNKIRILTADAGEEFRSLLNDALSEEPDMEVIASTGDGQEAIRLAKELVPEIAAVQTKRGVGNATFCCPPETVMKALREQTKEALGRIGRCHVELPEKFVYEVTYKDWKKAYQMSFFPGMKAVDPFTNRLETENWMDVVTSHNFVVY